ncbi:cytochrome P450 [Embleya scabrispora]|uniref:cytochrome P450 n=1 Tax=Embleya scabrispora TaxID=159449 RepID=UPI00036F52B2|nr:cytochrome P450 [Embleya scabrispora]MYS79224.1 cytochrome P450 [Streptomyces sp. SID5474]
MIRRLFATDHPVTSGQDISSMAFWRRSFVERDQTFAWLREHCPVSWQQPLEDADVPPDVHGEAGFWAVTRAEDISYISQNNRLFSTSQGSIMVRPRHPDTIMTPNFLEMDPPQHTRYRQIMSAAFTPKAVARLNAQIEKRAHDIVNDVVGAGDIDFVSSVSAKLPMLTIADMVGVPESLVTTFAQAGDNFVGGHDESMLPPGMTQVDFMVRQLTVLRDIGVDLVHYRREHPSDDIATALGSARMDGKPLSDDEIASTMLLLSVAGNDTTKQTTSWTVLNLDRNPDERTWLLEDFTGRIAGSIEEFVRHATPVMCFGRVALEDVELRGVRIQAGDKVGIFYCSGNRDEHVFEDPHRFSLGRPRTPHVGFGGGGIHYCLGNGIARAQLRALFAEILTQLPRLEVGEPEMLNSEFINGIRRLPVRTN